MNNIFYHLESNEYTPTKNVRNYCHLAYSLAYKHSNVRKAKHCAIILDEHENILTTGVNRNYDQKSIHAEHDALNELNEKHTTTPHTIIVIKICKLGGYANSRPCLKCLNRIKQNQMIKRIIWSIDNEHFHSVFV